MDNILLKIKTEMERKTLAGLVATLFLALALGCSCSREEEPSPDAEDVGKVNLILKMSVNIGGSYTNDDPDTGGTRAGEVGFEEPLKPWEGVKSLRVIIVRPGSNNLVEHNEKYLFPEDEQIWEGAKQYEYEVVGGEYKRVYLIGNEDSLGESFTDRLKEIQVGENLPMNLDNVGISYDGNAPYITNTATEGKYVPLSEIFEFRVKASKPNGSKDENKDEANLFITRIASKFSFTVKSIPEDLFSERGMKITDLTVSGMADREWFFPHNTFYSPAKFEISTNPLNGRLITSFSTPAETKTFSYNFKPASFGIKGGSANTDLTAAYAPLEYFLESPANGFTLTGTAVSNGLERPFSATLPNLPRMPRNTHTVVNLTFKGENLEVEVNVVPYTSVVLEPIFGLEGDPIIKPPKPREPAS